MPPILLPLPMVIGPRWLLLRRWLRHLHGGMTLLASAWTGSPPAGCAQCYLVIEHDVIADLCRLSNHYTGSMVYEETPANLCSGVNLDATGYETGKLRDQAWNKRDVRFIEGVGDTMIKYRP